MIRPVVRILDDVAITNASGPGFWIGMINELGELVPAVIDEYSEGDQPAADEVKLPFAYTR